MSKKVVLTIEQSEDGIISLALEQKDVTPVEVIGLLEYVKYAMINKRNKTELTEEPEKENNEVKD